MFVPWDPDPHLSFSPCRINSEPFSLKCDREKLSGTFLFAHLFPTASKTFHSGGLIGEPWAASKKEELAEREPAAVRIGKYMHLGTATGRGLRQKLET